MFGILVFLLFPCSRIDDKLLMSTSCLVIPKSFHSAREAQGVSKFVLLWRCTMHVNGCVKSGKSFAREDVHLAGFVQDAACLQIITMITSSLETSSDSDPILFCP